MFDKPIGSNRPISPRCNPAATPPLRQCQYRPAGACDSNPQKENLSSNLPGILKNCWGQFPEKCVPNLQTHPLASLVCPSQIGGLAERKVTRAPKARKRGRAPGTGPTGNFGPPARMAEDHKNQGSWEISKMHHRIKMADLVASLGVENLRV